MRSLRHPKVYFVSKNVNQKKIHIIIAFNIKKIKKMKNKKIKVKKIKKMKNKNKNKKDEKKR